jgi:hypothetical protein
LGASFVAKYSLDLKTNKAKDLLMEPFNHKTSFFISVLVIISASCQKKALPDLPKPITKTDMVAYSPWRIAARGFDTTNDGTIDLDETPTFPCVLDNRTYFYEGGDGSFDQGQIKCDSSHNQSRRFKWLFTDNETMIIVDGLQYKIISLTERDFVVGYAESSITLRSTYILKLIH